MEFITEQMCANKFERFPVWQVGMRSLSQPTTRPARVGKLRHFGTHSKTSSMRTAPDTLTERTHAHARASPDKRTMFVSLGAVRCLDRGLSISLSIYIPVYLYIYIYAFTYIHTFIDIYCASYISKYIYVYTHTHTHTHTHTLRVRGFTPRCGGGCPGVHLQTKSCSCRYAHTHVLQRRIKQKSDVAQG